MPILSLSQLSSWICQEISVNFQSRPNLVVAEVSLGHPCQDQLPFVQRQMWRSTAGVSPNTTGNCLWEIVTREVFPLFAEHVMCSFSFKRKWKKDAFDQAIVFPGRSILNVLVGDLESQGFFFPANLEGLPTCQPTSTNRCLAVCHGPGFVPNTVESSHWSFSGHSRVH